MSRQTKPTSSAPCTISGSSNTNSSGTSSNVSSSTISDSTKQQRTPLDSAPAYDSAYNIPGGTFPPEPAPDYDSNEQFIELDYDRDRFYQKTLQHYMQPIDQLTRNRDHFLPDYSCHQTLDPNHHHQGDYYHRHHPHNTESDAEYQEIAGYYAQPETIVAAVQSNTGRRSRSAYSEDYLT